MSVMSASLRRLVPFAALARLAALTASSAQAVTTWRTYSLTTKSSVPGIASSTAYLHATFLIKGTWKPLSIKKTSLRFKAGNSRCFYSVGFSLKTVVGPAATPLERVTADLPVKASNYILDSGTRSPGAWRVTRDPGNQPVKVHGEYARRAVMDPGLVPSGQVGWSSIVVSATSLPGGECHAGSWRSSLGPTIGDAFATTRMSAYVRRTR